MEKKLLELIAKEKLDYDNNTSRTRKHTTVLKLYYENVTNTDN